MDYLHIPDSAYDKLLEKDPKLIQMDVCDFIAYLRQKNSASSSVSTYLSGIRHFYDINGVDLYCKRIHKFEGEKEKRAEDRPYTHSEIKLLLDHTNLRTCYHLVNDLFWPQNWSAPVHQSKRFGTDR